MSAKTVWSSCSGPPTATAPVCGSLTFARLTVTVPVPIIPPASTAWTVSAKLGVAS